MWVRNQSEARAAAMVESGLRTAVRYRARAARRPLLFWWQAFLILGASLLLWSRLPVAAVFYEPRVPPPLPDAHAEYVVLDPAYAAQAYRKTVLAWTLGGSAETRRSGADFGLDDLNDPLPAPVFLEQGQRYPGVWRAAAVTPLPQRLSDVTVPSVGQAPAVMPLPDPPQGVRVVADRALAAAGFAVAVPEKMALPGEEGSGRFYVETGEDGRVEHVLVFGARDEAVAAFERVLLRGRAKGHARGRVEIYWKFRK